MVPHVSDAVDEVGHHYAAAVRFSGVVSLITLQHGFAKRPKWVDIQVRNGPHRLLHASVGLQGYEHCGPS